MKAHSALEYKLHFPNLHIIQILPNFQGHSFHNPILHHAIFYIQNLRIDTTEIICDYIFNELYWTWGIAKTILHFFHRYNLNNFIMWKKPAKQMICIHVLKQCSPHQWSQGSSLYSPLLQFSPQAEDHMVHIVKVLILNIQCLSYLGIPLSSWISHTAILSNIKEPDWWVAAKGVGTYRSNVLIPRVTCNRVKISMLNQV